MSSMASMGAPQAWRGGLTVVLALAAISTSAIAIRLAAPVPPLWIAALRVGITACLWGGWGVAFNSHQDRKKGRGGAEPFWPTVVVGAILAAHFATWIASLFWTTVLRSTILVSTQPLFAALLARWAGDSVSWRLYAGFAVAFAGMTLWLLAPGSDASASTHFTSASIGDGLALAAGATMALYLIAGRRLTRTIRMPLYLFRIHVAAACCLVIAALARDPWPQPLLQPTQWAAIAYLGVVPGWIGHGLLNRAVRQMPAHTVGLTVLLEPIGAGLLAWWLLDEAMQLRDLLGAAVILGGVALGVGLFHGRRGGDEVHRGASSASKVSV